MEPQMKITEAYKKFVFNFVCVYGARDQTQVLTHDRQVTTTDYIPNPLFLSF